jgi:hypothetical protein
MKANVEGAEALPSGTKPLSKKSGRKNVINSKEHITRYKAN